MIRRALRDDTSEVYKANAIIESESRTANQTDPRIPVIQLAASTIPIAIARGDGVFFDDEDPRLFIWFSADNPDFPSEVIVKHMWGPSDRHDALLLTVARLIINEGWGDVPVRFARGTPLSERAIALVRPIIVTTRTEAIASNAVAAELLLVQAGISTGKIDVRPLRPQPSRFVSAVKSLFGRA